MECQSAYPTSHELSKASVRLRQWTTPDWHVDEWRRIPSTEVQPTGHSELLLVNYYPILRRYLAPRLWGVKLPWGGETGLDLERMWKTELVKSLMDVRFNLHEGLRLSQRYLDLGMLPLGIDNVTQVIVRPRVVIETASKGEEKVTEHS